MPPEFCEHGSCFDRCRPWIEANCPELLNSSLNQSMAKLTVSSTTSASSSTAAAASEEAAPEAASKKKGGGAAAPRKATTIETKVIVTKIQRQKRKYVTSIIGLDTIPDLKIKDAVKLLGKKFASGASIGETPKGEKEVTIQGDVSFEVPPLLISEYKIDGKCIYFLDDNVLRPYAM